MVNESMKLIVFSLMVAIGVLTLKLVIPGEAMNQFKTTFVQYVSVMIKEEVQPSVQNEVKESPVVQATPAPAPAPAPAPKTIVKEVTKNDYQVQISLFNAFDLLDYIMLAISSIPLIYGLTRKIKKVKKSRLEIKKLEAEKI